MRHQSSGHRHSNTQHAAQRSAHGPGLCCRNVAIEKPPLYCSYSSRAQDRREGLQTTAMSSSTSTYRNADVEKEEAFCVRLSCGSLCSFGAALWTDWHRQLGESFPFFLLCPILSFLIPDATSVHASKDQSWETWVEAALGMQGTLWSLHLPAAPGLGRGPAPPCAGALPN